MCTRWLAVLVALIAWLVGTSATAGALISATWQQAFQGVDLTITNGGAFCTATNPGGPGQVIGCPSSGLSASGSSTSTHYSVSLTVPLFTLDQFALGGTIPINTHATLAGAQLVTGTKRAATATVGVGGRATVKTAAHDKKSVYVPGMSSLLKVPLSVGKAGIFTNYFIVLGVLHYITVDFYAWTPLSVTFSSVTSRYVPLPTPTVVAMGSFGLTAMGGGTVTLVSPSKISIDGSLARRRTASFASLKLTYAPEPGILLLLGAGAAGLLRAGSRKRS